MSKKILIYVFTLFMIVALSGCQSGGDKVLVSKTSVYNDQEEVYTYAYEDDLLVEMYLDGELRESYEYDEDGNVIKITRIDSEIRRKYQNGNVVESEMILDDGTVYTGLYEYNSDNDLVKFSYSQSGNVIGVYEYTYSQSENIQKCEYESGMVKENISTLDEAGNAILEVEYIDGEETQVVEKNYNSSDLLIESIATFSDNGEKIINTYEYDNSGNMIAAYEQINDGERKLVDSYVYE